MAPAFPELGGSPLETEDSLLQAVNAFYAAFNGRDLGTMKRVWAPDGILYNPIGGIARAGPKYSVSTSAFSSGPSAFVWCFTNTRCTRAGIGPSWLAGNAAPHGAGMNALNWRSAPAVSLPRSAGEWRQVHHHGSIDDSARLSNYQRLVRS